jgi:hypothetical protein
MLLAVCVFGGGLLASGVFSSTVPAAPQQCLPVVGCVTTTVTTTVPTTVPTPPPVTLPTLPTTTTTTAGAAPSDPPATETTSSGPGKEPSSAQAGETALTAKASVRVRGRGARRVVEIRVQLSKPARVSTLLTRSRSVLARRQFEAPAGSSVLRLPVGRATKPGPARLALTYRSAAGETARASYRLRLPR